MTAHIQGLTEAEAAARRQRGQGNDAAVPTSRSYADILRQNILNFINIVLFSIGTVLVLLGRVGDAVLSVGLIALNIVIGVYQEVRAKRALDQIALLTRPRALVIREGIEKQIDPAEIVLGDVLVLKAGDQIVVDGKIIGNGKVEVDESLLTGESDLIPKRAGDEVLSGSYCVSGSALYEATRVGAESFANKLTTSARQFRVVKTPLQREIDFVLRLLTLMAVFIGFLMAVSAFLYTLPLVRGVQMASVIAGLVPNGLFFMVIVAYAMGALRIATQGALIQQSNSVESLSNVNVLCMDKTGTLTANKINFEEAHPIEITKAQLERWIGDFAHSVTAGNRTSAAIAAEVPGSRRALVDEVPFSSALKWSAIATKDDEMSGVFVLGALEMLEPFLKNAGDLRERAREWSERGLRVLIFAHDPDAERVHDSQGLPSLPAGLRAVGILVFSDELRPDAAETLAQFAQAGIRLKIISGDNPHTVAALAKQAGLQGDLPVISGTELAALDDSDFEEAAEEATIFGRITPEQKERLVGALRKRGYYVAMIGDGVNDVLSLKRANLGIAMQSGSTATRGVADMVLLNDSFAALPPAFLEGQRIINGMQDILRLFLTRALFVALLILSTAVINLGFPYVPKHVALLTLLTVGIPTLALAAWARPGPVKSGLLRSVTHFVVPATFSVFVFGLLIYVYFFTRVLTSGDNVTLIAEALRYFENYLGVLAPTSDAVAFEAAGLFARSALTTFTILSGLMLVVFVEPPYPFFVGGDELSPDKRPLLLVLLMLAAFVVILLVEPLRNFFELILLAPLDYAIIVGAVIVWAFVLRAAWRGHWLERFLNLERALRTPTSKAEAVGQGVT